MSLYVQNITLHNYPLKEKITKNTIIKKNTLTNNNNNNLSE